MSQKLNKIRAEIHAFQTEIGEVKRAALDDVGIGAKVDSWLDGMEQRSSRNFTDIAHELAYESKNPGAGYGGVWMSASGLYLTWHYRCSLPHIGKSSAQCSLRRQRLA